MRNKLKRFTKKSQVSIFVIIAVLLLVGSGIFLYSTKRAQEKFEPEIKIIQEQVPIEFDPIRSYAESCVYSASIGGLKIIGEQGGYISFTNKSLSKESFALTSNPTESDAVSFTKDSDLRIPYWWHLKSQNICNNDCKFASQRPDLRQTENSIEKQLERYIDFKFKECIDGFKPFVEQGFRITETGKLKSDVTIASDDVVVVVEYPLSVERQDTKSELSNFAATIPLDLENIYELATKITNLQIKHNYIEKHIMNLIVAFSGVDKNKLPPISDMQFKFGSSTSWKKSEVKDKITGLLSSYISLFQVDGTYNYERNIFDSELKQRLYDSTILPVANNSFENLAAYFTYLDFWPAYFDLNCNGERCAPSSTNTLLPISFGIQSYKFVYDLSFPVLVEIKDPFALNGEGYTFNLFLEGNIRDNKPMEASYTSLEFQALSERSQLCDIRTSGDVAIKVADSSTKKPLEDAQVIYTIIDEGCFIGSTDSEGALVEKFPVGVGGFVSFSRDSYIGKSLEFDAKIGEQQPLNAELVPIYAKKLVVKKKNVVKAANGWEFKDESIDLNDKESAVVTLTRIPDENELEFFSVANYEGKSPVEIEVAPGNYAADITLTLNERIVVPEKQKCESKGILGEECYTIPKLDFGEGSSQGQETFGEGGLKMNFTISASDLQAYDTIVLHAISIDIANVPEQNRVVEDLDQLGRIEEHSTKNQLALQPEFR